MSQLLYARYGNYFHALAGVGFQVVRRPWYNSGKIQIGYTETWTINGELQAATQSDLDTAIATLKAAYAIPGQDLGIFFESGVATNHVLLSSGTQGGVRVTSGVNFPGSSASEFGLYRMFSVTLEADVIDPTVGLMGFYERISFQGNGGPKVVHLETLTGLAQPQITQQCTLFRATQTGQAIGRFAYPVPLGPIWNSTPPLLSESAGIDYGDPQRSGPAGTPTYSDWPVSWSYAYESPIVLGALPRLWGL